MLDRIAVERGSYPAKLRMDNGPELASPALAAWAEEYGVPWSSPRRANPRITPISSASTVALPRRVLDLYVFGRLADVWEVTEEFIRHYNKHRPHEALDI